MHTLNTETHKQQQGYPDDHTQTITNTDKHETTTRKLYKRICICICICMYIYIYTYIYTYITTYMCI